MPGTQGRDARPVIGDAMNSRFYVSVARAEIFDSLCNRIISSRTMVQIKHRKGLYRNGMCYSADSRGSSMS